MAIPGSIEVIAGNDTQASEYNGLRRDVMEMAGDYAVATGSANAFVVAMDAAIDSYQAGLIIKFQANFNISGSCTVNVNSLGAKTIKYQGKTLILGQIHNGDFLTAIYDGTDFQLLTPPREVEMYKVLRQLDYIGSIDYGITSASFYTDDKAYLAFADAAINFMVQDMRSGGDIETRDVTSDWADADLIIGLAKIGTFLYVGMIDTATNATRVYRYAANDIGAGGTNMTITTLGTTAEPDDMICDGTNLYFNNDGGDTATSNHIWEGFSISGTTLTSIGKTTCGASDANFESCDMDLVGNFYGYNASDFKIRRYNTSGTLQATTTATKTTSASIGASIEGVPHVRRTSAGADGILEVMPLLP